jgi:DNA polymerase III gamma/tau subunit
MVGNTDTIKALENMLLANSLPHTILFSGPSGCGKTTLARIMAASLGCNPMDIFEQNCSDKRGIDDIREIRNLTRYAAIGESRAWILDEAHMLTKEAQNAALKMLEDTPDQVYFFLCTTDPKKLIKTIRNRCTDMPVRLLSNTEIAKLVKRTARKEKIELGEEILEDLVDNAAGSARSALVSLNKIRNLSPEEQAKALQETEEGEKLAIDLCRALIQGDRWATVAKILKEMKDDPEKVRWSVLGYARSVLLGGGAKAPKAHSVIQYFESHFYDSKAAGLAGACWSIVNGEE